MAAEKDCWAQWVATMRPPASASASPGGSPVLAWRDRVLDNAEPIRGQAVLDLGCGEGLVAFDALDRGAQEVIFSDISQDLLDFCHDAASESGVLARCRFVRASATDLTAIDDLSVDVVTSRSVLIYVRDKQAAFLESARILRSGGRISFFEPINRFAQTSANTWAGFDLSPIADIARKLRAVYDAIQPPDTDPMLDFDERDLLELAEHAGFHPIHLQLEAEIKPSVAISWDEFISRAGNPRVPTIATVMAEALDDDERRRFIAHLRPLVEQGFGTWRMATAFIHAVKP